MLDRFGFRKGSTDALTASFVGINQRVARAGYTFRLLTCLDLISLSLRPLSMRYPQANDWLKSSKYYHSYPNSYSSSNSKSPRDHQDQPRQIYQSSPQTSHSCHFCLPTYHSFSCDFSTSNLHFKPLYHQVLTAAWMACYSFQIETT